jgi:transcriptional regulator with XRE-family HTH domain
MLERLKKARKMLGFNQKTFAAGLGLSQSHYCWIERGGVEFSDRNIKLVCAVYGINENWLRTGAGEMFLENNAADPLGVLTPDERALLDRYGKLDKQARSKVRQYIDDLLAVQEYKARNRPGAAG